MRVGAIRDFVEANGGGQDGQSAFLRLMDDLLEGRKLDNGRTIKAKPQDFSLRGLWEALVGRVEDTLENTVNRGGYVETRNISEALASTAFPSAVGQLISRSVIAGYEREMGYIGDDLVEIMPSRLRGERVVGFTHLQGPKVVGELESYEDSSMGEKYVGTRETKRGRLLSISEETVIFDQTNEILRRASNLGLVARQERERRIIRAVIDADSGEAVYQPNGTAEQLYSAGNNNLLSTATPLIDWTDIQEAFTFHCINVADDRQDEDGLPIVWMPRQLLTAVELAGTAARIVSATSVDTAPGNTSTASMRSGNPVSSFAPGLRPMASPFIDTATDGDQWDDASDWFIGDFPMQFKYKQIYPIQTLRAPAQNQEQFERDVLVRYKVREYGDVVAVDEKFVLKVNAA